MIPKKINRIFIWVFYVVFGICFSLITANALLNNTYHQTAYLLPGVAICLMGMVGVFKILSRMEENLKKKYYIILAVFCIGMLTIQIITGKILRYEPVFDVGAVYYGAVEWANTGTFSDYYDYFEWFPNNLGAMTFLSFFFRLSSLFGITDFYMVAVIVNSVMSACMMGTVSLICKRLKGEKYGVFALCIFALSLPFYIIGAAFYTDGLSMLFPVLVYYFYLKSKDEEKRVKRILYYVLMGLAGAIGMQIKFTVLIGVIAVIIDMLFNCDYKRVLSALGCLSVVILAVTLLINGVIYGYHLDRKTAERKNTPYTHWIMMGFHEKGFYNPEDYEFTRSFEDASERNQAIREEIASTIREHKYAGIFDLFLGKMTTDFGDGTYGLADCVGAPHGEDKALHQYVTYNGKKYKGYSHYCTSLQITLLIIIGFGAYSAVIGKKKSYQQELTPFVAVFGIMLFLMIWETNRRYFSNFVPMLFICSVLSIDCVVAMIKEKTEGIKKTLCT